MSGELRGARLQNRGNAYRRSLFAAIRPPDSIPGKASEIGSSHCLKTLITVVNRLWRCELKKSCAIPSARLLRSVSFAAAFVSVIALPVFGRDLDGCYVASPLHDWFEHLASG